MSCGVSINLGKIRFWIVTRKYHCSSQTTPCILNFVLVLNLIPCNCRKENDFPRRALRSVNYNYTKDKHRSRRTISNSKRSSSILSISKLTRNSEVRRCPVRNFQSAFPIQFKSYGWLDGFSANHYTKHEWETMQNFNRVWNVDAVNWLPVGYQLESRAFTLETKRQPESTNTMPQSQNTASGVFITNCAINGQVCAKNLKPSTHISKCSEDALSLRHRTTNPTVKQFTSEGQDNYHKATTSNYYKNQQGQKSSCRWLLDLNKNTDTPMSCTKEEKHLNCNIITPLTSSFCNESTMLKKPKVCFNYFKVKLSHALKFLKPHSENQVQL